MIAEQTETAPAEATAEPKAYERRPVWQMRRARRAEQGEVGEEGQPGQESAQRR